MSHECDGGCCCTERHWRHGRDYTAAWAASLQPTMKKKKKDSSLNHIRSAAPTFANLR